MQIDVTNSDILAFDGDAIMVPGDSTGRLTEGLAARVKKAVGKAGEDAVVAHAPIAVGAALATDAGPLPARCLIYAPLVETAGLRVGVENVRRATRASLLAAEAYELERIAIPGMGFGETGVSHEEAARAMIDEVSGFKGALPLSVVLASPDPEMFEALRTQVR